MKRQPNLKKLLKTLKDNNVRSYTDGTTSIEFFEHMETFEVAGKQSKLKQVALPEFPDFDQDNPDHLAVVLGDAL